MKPFLRYPGSKSAIAPIIAHLLQKYVGGQYREPFVGGGGFTLFWLSQLPPSNVWLNDVDHDIAALWTTIYSEPGKLISKVLSFVPTVEAFNEARETLLVPSTIDLPTRAFLKIVVHRLSFSGLGLRTGSVLGGHNQSSAYTVDCRWNGQRLAKQILSAHYILKKHSLFMNECTAVDFAELCGDRNGYLYLDPPYYKKGGELYHHSFSVDDHQRLAGLLQSHPAWILSYDAVPEIYALYQNQWIQELSLTYHLKNKGKCNELVIAPYDFVSPQMNVSPLQMRLPNLMLPATNPTFTDVD